MTGPDTLKSARRIIVKIGAALLVDPETGAVHRKWLESLAEDLARFRARGQEMIIVSSGAIAVGRRHLGLASGQLRLEESQAAAATGMVRLAHAYQEVLAHHDLTVAQVLVTLDDSENRRWSVGVGTAGGGGGIPTPSAARCPRTCGGRT